MFCWLLQVLKVAFARSKLAGSGRNREQSIQMVQTSHELSPQPLSTFIFREAMHGYARGIAGVLAADFIWSTGYAVPSTVLDSTLSHIYAMYRIASCKANDVW